MKKQRGLSQFFMEKLKSDPDLGIHRYLEVVKKDQTLCLEIRKNFINIYYRGGNLIRLEEKSGKFTASFDRNYILEPSATRLPQIINRQILLSFDDVTTWIEAVPLLKQAMDYWFSRHPKNEREFQQLLVRENNFGDTARGTDYFICDIEYANSQGRFDLIAARWPSTGSHRKNNQDVGLAFIEMKYMSQALANSSGIASHVEDMVKYFGQSQDNFSDLKLEMKNLFNQKLELGLIDNQKPIENFNDDVPVFILIFANHDPAASKLSSELEKLKPMAGLLPFEIKIAISSFMGYGLYEQCIFDLDEFQERFSGLIYSR